MNCHAPATIDASAVDVFRGAARDLAGTTIVDTPPGVVEVLQTAPVTVVRVEHSELAFESSLAAAIEVSGA